MKNLKLSNILFLTLIVCAIFSCSNQETEIESVESKDMVQPDFLKKGSSYNTLSELYKNLDETILKSGNESQITSYIQEKNVEIIDYLVSKYPQYNDAANADTKDLAILHFGLVHAIAEENRFSSDLSANRLPD